MNEKSPTPEKTPEFLLPEKLVLRVNSEFAVLKEFSDGVDAPLLQERIRTLQESFETEDDDKATQQYESLIIAVESLIAMYDSDIKKLDEQLRIHAEALRVAKEKNLATYEKIHLENQQDDGLEQEFISTRDDVLKNMSAIQGIDTKRVLTKTDKLTWEAYVSDLWQSFELRQERIQHENEIKAHLQALASLPATNIIPAPPVIGKHTLAGSIAFTELDQTTSRSLALENETTVMSAVPFMLTGEQELEMEPLLDAPGSLYEASIPSLSFSEILANVPLSKEEIANIPRPALRIHRRELPDPNVITQLTAK